MKYLYTVQIKKADGTMWAGGVLAADATEGGVTTPASVNAINYGFSQAGAGAMLQNCFLSGQVDHDTTA